MRHQKSGKKFSRTSAHRDALWSNMVSSLIQSEKIKTTLPKAKELRRFAEPVIAWATSVAPLLSKAPESRSLEERVKILHAVKMARRIVKDRSALTKLFEELSLRFKERAGGYLRITKAGFRVGDAAPMSYVELVD